MATSGNAVLGRGKRVLNPQGYARIFNAAGKCEDACCIVVAAEEVTNEDNPIWVLPIDIGANVACAYWRLIETGTCWPPFFPWFGADVIDENGTFVNAPLVFESLFPHDGFIELQIGCKNEDGQTIDWSGDCQINTPISEF